MKTLFTTTALCAVLLLGACANTANAPAPLQTAVTNVQTAVSNLGAFTQADLTTAIAQANAAVPPDTETVSCFTYLSGQLTALQGQLGTSAPTTVGAAVAFETARLALNNANSLIAPTSKTALETACGPLAMSVTNQGLTFVNEASALVALLK
jgi:hypothetical protein